MGQYIKIETSYLKEITMDSIKFLQIGKSFIILKKSLANDDTFIIDKEFETFIE